MEEFQPYRQLGAEQTGFYPFEGGGAHMDQPAIGGNPDPAVHRADAHALRNTPTVLYLARGTDPNDASLWGF